MKLSDIAAMDGSFPLDNLADEMALAQEVQTVLIRLGLLDPPVNGRFGPISRFTVAKFAEHLGLPFDDALTPRIADAMLTQTEASFMPLALGNDLASRIVKYMQFKGYHVVRMPGALNIVYLEGADVKGTPIKDSLDKWNDRRMLISIGADGVPMIDFNAKATTEPGRFFTTHPLNSNGAARIALDQFKAWQVGFHHPGLQPPRRHEALVQSDTITIFRDKNEDGLRAGDPVEMGSSMGINQHSGLDANANSIGQVSAGCLVGRSNDKHKEFMRRVKKDVRYAEASTGYTFMTAVIFAKDLEKEFPAEPITTEPV
jgi:hypothetical protein